VGNSLTIDRTKSGDTNNPLTVQLVLPLDNSGAITGTVASANEGWSADMSGAVGITSHTYDGLYSLVVSNALPDDTDNPGGWGYNFVTITNGVITAKGGALGDGQAFTSIKANVSADGQWPLFSWGNKNATTLQLQSLIMGWVTVGGSTNGLDSEGLLWIRQASGVGRYTAGFTNVVGIRASPYGNPPVFGTPNLTVSLYNGGLTNATDQMSHSVTVGVGNVFSFGTPNVSAYKLKLTPLTGKLSGSWKPAQFGAFAPTFNGVLLTNINSGYGTFLPSVTGSFSNLAGAFELTP
jgi:hypothetical protein